MIFRSIFLLVLFTFTSFVFSHDEIQDEIDHMILSFKDKYQVEGVAVGIIHKDPSAFENRMQRIFTYGDLSKRSVFSVNDHTEFRIAQITKIFTSTILAHFVHEGKVKLSDPVSKYLSRSVKIPSFHGKEITFLDLATHTSGLPDISYDLSKQSAFTVRNLYRFLDRYHLSRAPGETYEYSNLGYALLTNVLTRIAKETYPTLVSQIVLDPLRLEDTVCRLDKEQQRRFATGYQNKRVFPSSMQEKGYSVFLGSGGLNSTIHDMLLFLAYNLHMDSTTIDQLLPIVQKPYFTVDSGFQMGLGWEFRKLRGVKPYAALISSGQLFGFSTFMGMVKEKKIGVVILTNQGDAPIDELGEKLLSYLKRSAHKGSR